MTEIIVAKLDRQRQTLPVYQMAKKNNFYAEQVYQFLFRKLSPDNPLSSLPESIQRKLTGGSSGFSKYDKYEFQLRLLKRGTTLVGFALWNYPRENNGKCCLEFLLIDETEQGKGYGKILMDDFIKWADKNRPHVLIQIPANDERCKHIYSKYGFTPKPNPKDTPEIVDWERKPL
jgi:GNAT superfamily N-acetyltransferase